MGKVIGFINQKGGVAKTTASNNLAYMLANEKGKKVLLIDWDGQASTTDCYGILEYLNQNIDSEENIIMEDEIPNTIVDLIDIILNDGELPNKEDFIYKIKGIDIIAGSSDLDNFEDFITKQKFRREFILKKLVDKLKDDYDYVIIDCLPKIGIQMYNALFACDEVIIPTSASKKGVKGLARLIKEIQNVKSSGNENLKIDGIFFSMVNEGTNVAKIIIEDTKKEFGKNNYIFETIIPYIKIFEETDLMNKIWVEYKPKHKCSLRYKDFLEEFLKIEERG